MENKSKSTAKRVTQTNSEPHPRWPRERKQGRFSSRNWGSNVCVDIIPQNRRQDLVTKSLFSSRTTLGPSKRLRIRLLGSRQTAVGEPADFRQEIFRRATVFQIRCSSQQATPILNFRTEQFPKGESASPAAWSPVRKWGEIFSKKQESPWRYYITGTNKIFCKGAQGRLAALWPSPPLWVLFVILFYLLIFKALLPLAKVSETVYPSAPKDTS